MPSTVARRLLPILLLGFAIAGLTAAGCSGENPYDAAKSAASSPSGSETAGPDSTINEFLPVRENASDCIGAVERPDCGSNAKGGWQMYLTFGVLIAGMSFIGWRVVRGVRARDAAMIE